MHFKVPWIINLAVRVLIKLVGYFQVPCHVPFHLQPQLFWQRRARLHHGVIRNVGRRGPTPLQLGEEQGQQLQHHQMLHYYSYIHEKSLETEQPDLAIDAVITNIR